MAEPTVRQTVYSAGYQRLNLETFVRDVGALRAVVADVRLKPQSRNFVWNRRNLESTLGLRYVWIPELGNLNYKGGPIVLQAPAPGLLALANLLTQSPVVVLCVCADPKVCHRTVVLHMLHEQHPDLQVILWDKRHAEATQALTRRSLFDDEASNG